MRHRFLGLLAAGAAREAPFLKRIGGFRLTLEAVSESKRPETFRLDEYNGTEECSWMLLEEMEGGEGEEGEAA